MIPRPRALLLGFVLTCCLAGFPTAALAEGPVAAQSIGVHYEETEFGSVLARPGGGLLAVQSGRLEGYLEDGAPDPSVAPVAGRSEGRLFPVADGSSFLVGYGKLTRLDADGGVDGSFGEGGTMSPPIAAEAVYELASGRILLLGTQVSGTHALTGTVESAVLSADGKLVDGSRAGRRVEADPELDVAEVSATPDGGVLVAGWDFLLELNPDGSVRRGFGEDGVVDEPLGVVGARVLPDGAVEAVGSVVDEASRERDLAVYRLTRRGRPDASFGPKGARRFDLGGQDEARFASWAPDGSVLVGGRTAAEGDFCRAETTCEETPFVAAFAAAGDPDRGFGQDGVLRLASFASPQDGYPSDGVTAMTRRADGSIVVAGNAPPNRTSGFLAALSPQGALLPGFGEAGIVRSPEPREASQEMAGLLALPEGRILGVGSSDLGIREQPVMVRYLPGGGLDPSFGDGAGFVGLGPAEVDSHPASRFAAGSGEVLTSTYGTGRTDLLLVAHEADGSPVASFGAGGAVPLPGDLYAVGLGVAEGGDPVVLAARHFDGSPHPGVVLRFAADGSLDKAFAGGGRSAMRLPDGSPVEGRALVTAPGGRTYAAGSIEDGFAVAGLLPDGRLDPRFGSGGWSITKFDTRTRQLAMAQIGSHIYLAGTIGPDASNQSIALMRLDLDGRPDRAFGRGGRVVVGLDSGRRPVQILPTPDGVLVVIDGEVRPLLNFSSTGRLLRRRAVGAKPFYAFDVRAAISEGSLLVGWARIDRPSSESPRYYFARRALG